MINKLWVWMSAAAVCAVSAVGPQSVLAAEAEAMDAALQLQKQHALERFASDEIVPLESKYFLPGIGVDGASGVPYDHVRIRLNNQKLAEVGLYTAGSKLSLHMAVLLKIALGAPELQYAALTPTQARSELEKILKNLIRFNARFAEYHGFYPWIEIRSVNDLVPSSNQVPSLDNGQLTWTLAAIVGALADSPAQADQRLVKMARQLLQAQDYGRFYDKDRQLLKGLAEIENTKGRWVLSPDYDLMDMNEGTLAVLWAVLHDQVPRAAWDNLQIKGADYITASGEKATTLQGYRGSFHEQWALLFLPFMDSALRPLYRNYLYVQADFARSQNLPGFLSTAHDPHGSYRQMGVPALAEDPAERTDVAVVYATAMGMAIDREIGLRWLKHFFNMPGLLTPFGAVESAGSDGFADVMTADGKGLTLLAIGGGVNAYIEAYLRGKLRPGKKQTLYNYFQELALAKFNQLKTERPTAQIYSPRSKIPLPGRYYPEVRPQPLELPGARYVITDHVASGHLHGKNVRTVGERTLQDDIRPEKPIAFEFNIPDSLPLEDQWAYRGTYLAESVGIEEMRFLTVTFPAAIKPYHLDIELKRDNVRLGGAWVDTSVKGHLTPDGRWKQLTLPLQPAPESNVMPLNYLSIVMHEPNFIRGEHAKYARKGKVVIRDITLSKKHPFGNPMDPDKVLPPAPGSYEILQYWVPSHGDLPVHFNEERQVFSLSAGPGWRGGLIPYSDLTPYTHCHVRIRNLSGRANSIFMEIKRDELSLFGEKFRIPLKPDARWRVFTIKLPPVPDALLNYLTLSDPEGDLELASISFSDQTQGGAP